MCNLANAKLRFMLVLLTLLTVLAAAEPAAAQGQDSYDIDFCDATCEWIAIGALSVALIPPLVFGSAEIVYATQGRWFPLGWAVPELIYGMLMTTLTSIAALSVEENGAVLVPFAAVYGWFTVHAILSVALGQPQPPQHARARSIDLAMAPLPGGAWLGVHGAL